MKGEMKDREMFLKILGEEGRMTTDEMDAYLKAHDDELDTACPDTTLKKLIWLKRKGYIKGKVSKEKKGWLWWVEK